MSGPLQGVRVLEVGGIGPTPFAGMLLADMGADVLRVDRTEPTGAGLFGDAWDATLRGRPCIEVDLKDAQDRDAVLGLADEADALIEGFRPGVMERLGLGPAEVHARNPRVVYGRMTGFGQDGPLAQVPGHDITYLGVAGALGAFQRAGEKPLAPLNLVGDYGGGAMFLAFGVVCGLLEAKASGQGQVIDAAMVDGAAVLTTMFHAMRAGGSWSDTAGANLLDSGSHFYDTYATSDDEFVAVGAIEPQFYRRLLELLEIDPAEMPQWDRGRWPEFKKRLATVFAAQSRAHWAVRFEHDDACVVAVQRLGEAPSHPHLQARRTFVEVDGLVQPAAAPRFSRTPGAAQPVPGDAAATLGRWGAAGAVLRDRLAAR